MGRLIVCSGAGISAESGISTFRDEGGLWEQHSIEEVCTMSTFQENYIAVNEFYNKRRTDLAKVDPNQAHIAIAEASKDIEVINITTNVDDLLERAGCEDVIHLHGDLTKIHNFFEHGGDNEEIHVGYKAVSDSDLVANYPVKPAVIFFGEMAPKYQILDDVFASLKADDVVIVVGSSEQVVQFVYTLAYATPDKWQYEEEARPDFYFVNPNLDNIILPSMFNVHQTGAGSFFTSDTFKNIITKLKKVEEHE